jgi:ABC-type glutathione transport system ATPase component
LNHPSTNLLQVEGLSVVFDSGKPTAHRALEGVSLSIGEGEVLGLVGESGSGKTVLSHTILGLLPGNGRVTSGKITWKGRELQNLSEKELRPIRGKEIAMIFQNPQASLNPVYPVGRQIEWVLRLHRSMSGPKARDEVLRLLESVKLRNPERIARSYPHELSGGMCQRVMISMALACQPLLLIADEPTSALDVKTQNEIIELLIQIRQEIPIAMLFVSHDLRTIRSLCPEVVVMNAGSASPRHRLTANGKTIEMDEMEKLLHIPSRSNHDGADAIEYAQAQARHSEHTLQSQTN